ncbi:helix-turn-helix domain-containing protein [Methylobacterium fujisawaense]
MRRSLDLSQEQLARLAGVAQGSLSRLERGTGAKHIEPRVREVLAKLSPCSKNCSRDA